MNSDRQKVWHVREFQFNAVDKLHKHIVRHPKVSGPISRKNRRKGETGVALVWHDQDGLAGFWNEDEGKGVCLICPMTDEEREALAELTPEETLQRKIEED